MAPLALILAALLSLPAQAAVLRVGPGEALTRMADAARLARDGDVVEIMAGDYRGDAAVAVWLQKRLTIRSRGGEVRLWAEGRHAESKAIWVLRNGVFEIEGIVFQGARVPAGNGAGIRFEGGRLLLRRCRFHDNEMGLMSANQPEAELVVEDSEFSHAAYHQQGNPHLLYAGRIAHLRVERSHFHHGAVGHLLKSRAAVNEILNNRLIDGDGGRASYEVDLPEGGRALLQGNQIEQSATTENLALVAFGMEGLRAGDNRLVMRGNTLVNHAGRPARWWRVAAGAQVEEADNRFIGWGVPQFWNP